MRDSPYEKLFEKLGSSSARLGYSMPRRRWYRSLAARVIAPERERRFVSANGLRRKTQLSRNQFLIFHPVNVYVYGGRDGTIDAFAKHLPLPDSLLFFLSPSRFFFVSLLFAACCTRFRTILLADEIAVCAFEAARDASASRMILRRNTHVFTTTYRTYERLTDLIHVYIENSIEILSLKPQNVAGRRIRF